ncbi:MAG: hypothetical protein QJR07_13890 [Acetobacteraceae bacterium]|nr:hypothetical protein [Acetobacteraceae bacterium]
MKAILAGILAAVVLAAAAAVVLDTEVQRTVQQQYHTEGVRL